MRNSKGQFAKGIVPWNKGLKVRLNTGRTHFKKGHQPTNGFEKGFTSWNAGLKGVMKAWNKGQKLPQFSEEKSASWKGDKVGYIALHHWVVKQRGKAIWCSHCGSCVNVQWANISHEYKRDVKDWMELCAKCHNKYDRANGWGLATQKFPERARKHYAKEIEKWLLA